MMNMKNGVPSCDFLKKAISDEGGAVGFYMNESDRVDNPALKKLIHDIAVDEMTHLRVYESLEKMFCSKEK